MSARERSDVAADASADSVADSSAKRLADANEPKEMTPEQLAEAKRYGRVSLQLDLADRAIDLVFLGVFALLVARPLDAWLIGSAGLTAWWWRLVAMFLIQTLAHLAVSFPLSFYSGHVVEHRFGLSRQTAFGWLTRYAKRHALTLGLGLVMIEGLWGIIYWTGGYWWLAAAGASFLVSVLLGRIVPTVILPLFYDVERLEDEPLLNRLNRRAEGTGLAVEGVYRLGLSAETAKANAMLAGLGRTRRVLLGDTLIDRFSPEEIEVVFAHEVGHHVHRHIPKLMALGLIGSAAGFAAVHGGLVAWFAALGEPLIFTPLPVSAVPLFSLLLLLLGMVAEPLMNALSRFHEVQADTYALDVTENPAAFCSAFRKLAAQNKADPNPPWLEVVWFHDHPPIAARIALAERTRAGGEGA